MTAAGHRREHVSDFFAQGLGVGPGAVHEYHEVVRLCRLPDYADRDVNVLVGELVLAAGAA